MGFAIVIPIQSTTPQVPFDQSTNISGLVGPLDMNVHLDYMNLVLPLNVRCQQYGRAVFTQIASSKQSSICVCVCANLTDSNTYSSCQVTYFFTS